MPERQSLLEAENAIERLHADHPMLREELRAMNVDPVAAGHPGGPHRLVAQLTRAR